jgi:hypothetical protein
MSDAINTHEVVGWFKPTSWELECFKNYGTRNIHGLTESEWLTTIDSPWWMIQPYERATEEFALNDKFRLPLAGTEPHPNHSPSCREWRERKSRLLACAAVRKIWHLLSGRLGQPFRELVSTIERFADGEVTAAGLEEVANRVFLRDRWLEPDVYEFGDLVYFRRARRAARSIKQKPHAALKYAVFFAMNAAAAAAFDDDPSDYPQPFIVKDVLWLVVEATGAEAAATHKIDNVRGPNSGTKRMSAEVCHLVRDIFGNPFKPVRFEPEWRTETAVLLARGMYESRDFSAMPILADALQDAGCDHQVILNHCREDAPHWRGCWVLDLVLGKD